MTHLFKLKKDGETVGYLNIDKGIHWSDEVSIPSNQIDFDTAHLFICKDKNANDVFGEDYIKGTVETILRTENVVGWIEWFEADKRWDLLTKEGSISIALSEIEDIELIEEENA